MKGRKLETVAATSSQAWAPGHSGYASLSFPICKYTLWLHLHTIKSNHRVVKNEDLTHCSIQGPQSRGPPKPVEEHTRFHLRLYPGPG